MTGGYGRGHQPTVAQRRPERQPRRHLRERWQSGCELFKRSTKAGASTPATPGLAMDSGRFVQALNEGRSVNPGDTRAFSSLSSTRRSLNEGRSVNPGDTRAFSSLSSTRRSLNEGRSVNPGDTLNRLRHNELQGSAQRRPERQPRRHPEPSPAQRVAGLRSTKAGASTPATLRVCVVVLCYPQSLNEGRSVNPGDTNLTGVVDGPPRSLNEGRSVNPGDTLNRLRHNELQGSAQRRPERQPRRHQSHRSSRWTPTVAQRRPERQPRRHPEPSPAQRVAGLRSTKAGASTPATLPVSLFIGIY